MFKTPKNIAAVVIGTGCMLIIISQLSFTNNEKTENYKSINPQYIAPQLPGKMSFAGEKTPLERTDIQEMFDRELIYNLYSQGHMLYLIKLSKRFFPVIEPILKSEGIPADFKYLCVAESNLQPLTSRVGAQGFWQFMASTAPAYALEVSKDVDERNDIVKSTYAATKYLKQAYNKLGSWTAAAASFNCGIGGYNAQATFQKTNNYYDLQLPTETNKYIFRILSLKHIMMNAEQLGFIIENDAQYKTPRLRKFTVSQSIPNLADWAITNGSTYRLMKYYNPWLVSRSLTVKPGKQYEILLP